VTSGAGSIAAALAAMFERLQPTAIVELPLTRAPGRTLAEDVIAGVELPPWDNSAMDGYACRAADVRSASADNPVRMPVAETIAAGAFATRALHAGEAMRIMTGAPLPDGADTVIRVEDTDGGSDEVLIRTARDAGRNVRRRGEDVGRGDTVARSGARIGAAEVAILAAVGQATVRVHELPRIGILCSGDELISVNGMAAGDDLPRVVSANSYSLSAIVSEAGGEPLDLGLVADDLDAMAAALERARDCDLLVTSGGISVGGFDFTRAAVERSGGEILFWRVPMRPGYNSAFGLVHDTPWLGVPGNPVSALIAGEVLLRPAVRRLCGSRTPLRERRRVIAAERLEGSGSVAVFRRATLEPSQSGPPHARLAGAQGSAILSTSVRADALLEIPAGVTAVEPGEEVNALIVRDEAAP
jgi:molybdopterin molybdotransferase